MIAPLRLSPSEWPLEDSLPDEAWLNPSTAADMSRMVRRKDMDDIEQQFGCCAGPFQLVGPSSINPYPRDHRHLFVHDGQAG